MSDFTKEELDLLNKSMLVDMLHNPCTDSMDALREKILYMIDNYCEHDGVKIIGVPGKQCKNCKRMIK